jgi:hypothetical protein
MIWREGKVAPEEARSAQEGAGGESLLECCVYRKVGDWFSDASS